ncbi:diguanylate cyclase [Amycolatopsis sp. NPDC059657]|uniref:GGDEF domain-containing protein n=1 Tax=Amycolatopsis sp. NPDC059657 TaxID=3346899 RepID=UPI00366F7BC7
MRGPIGGWLLWQRPPRVLGYVLAIDFLAVAAGAATAKLVPIGSLDLIRAGVLAIAAAAAIELTRHVERQREYARDSTVAYVDTKAVWSVAAVIVLPPLLATAMVVWTYVYAWCRIWPARRPIPAHRWVFAASTVLLGTQAAVAVLALGMHHYPGAPATALLPGLADVGVIAAAAVLRWAINTGLVMTAIALSGPETTVRELFSGFSQQLLEAGTAGLGLVVAVLLVVANPFVLAGVVIALVAIHRGILLSQHQLAARIDVTTGLFTKKWWTELAEETLRRAAGGTRVTGVLFLDLDHFKRINDVHGHPNGDLVLRAVADAVKAETRGQDAVGRFGGEEFAVLVPDIGTARNLENLAERIRLRIHTVAVDLPGEHGIRVTGLTVSIGAAVHPADGGTSVDDLLRAADHALYRAKNAGRDQVQTTRPFVE